MNWSDFSTTLDDQDWRRVCRGELQASYGDVAGHWVELKKRPYVRRREALCDQELPEPTYPMRQPEQTVEAWLETVKAATQGARA